MGIIINKDRAYNRDLPCHGYRYDGQFLLWKQGVIGTLTDDQEKALCDMAISYIEPMPERLKERMAVFRGLETPPFCLDKVTKDEAFEAVSNDMPTAPKEKHDRLLKVLRLIETLPTCP